ncbi:predicted protein, partial [Nematostella vectensis]
HLAPKCKFINATCHYCHKVGHIERVCLSKKKKQQDQTNVATDNSSGHCSPDEEYSTLYRVETKGVTPPLNFDVLVDGTKVSFQLDTG